MKTTRTERRRLASGAQRFAAHQTALRMVVLAAITLLVPGRTAAQALAVDGHAHPSSGCGATLSPEEARLAQWLQEQGFYTPPPVPEYLLQVPITVHVVRQTDGTGGLSDSQVASSLQTLNDEFIPIGMEFFQSGSTIYIDDDGFYNDIDTQFEIDVLKSISVVPNTINLYYTNSLFVEDDDDPKDLINLCGQASFTTTVIQGIVIKNSCSNSSTVPHEFGHFFDLYHTHEDVFGAECPDGSNCGTAGDFVCDTPADPELVTDSSLPEFNITPSCNYFGTETQCGQSYSPDTDNIMSYAPSSCRTRFTAGQRSRALATLVNLRPELIEPPGLGVVWVDSGFVGVSTGTYFNPFKTVGIGVAATGAGATMVLKGGTFFEPITITKSVVIDTFLQKAVIK